MGGDKTLLVIVTIFALTILAGFIVFAYRFFVGIPDYLERIADALEKIVEQKEEENVYEEDD